MKSNNNNNSGKLVRKDIIDAVLNGEDFLKTMDITQAHERITELHRMALGINK